jgi:hypothetical protein
MLRTIAEFVAIIAGIVCIAIGFWWLIMHLPQ